jgi:hypothetical protein
MTTPEVQPDGQPSVEEIYLSVRDELFPDEADWEFFISHDLDTEEALSYVISLLIARGHTDPASYLKQKGILI